MQSTHSQIKKAIKSKGRGKIFFAKDFMLCGTSVAVRHALSRLCKDKMIVRLSAGIYLYPKIHKQFGILYPSIENIAKAVAKQEKARLIPTGIYALNALGLSTQMPMKVIFLTDGTPRVINIDGKASIYLKKTIPKYLSFKGKITVLAIFALKEIGRENVADVHLQKIKTALLHESPKYIMNDAALAPEWISNIILKLVANG